MRVRALAALLVALLAALGAVTRGDSWDDPGATEGQGAGCKPGQQRTSRVVHVRLPASRYPNIADHVRDAVAGRDELGRRARAWPRVLRINRVGADERRDKLLAGIPTRPGFDRDEYAPAMARTRPAADVRYVESSENRSAGSVMGRQLSEWCDGTRFVLVTKG